MDYNRKSGYALKLFCQEFGVPEKLTFDGSKEQACKALIITSVSLTFTTRIQLVYTRDAWRHEYVYGYITENNMEKVLIFPRQQNVCGVYMVPQ